MESKLILEYHPQLDILHVRRCAPYAAQETEELGDDVIARLNPETGEIEDLEILFFTTRAGSGRPLELPVSALLRLTG